MNYQNLTPFPSLAFQALDAQGRMFHVAVLRITLEIELDGEMRLASNQTPLVITDAYHGEMNQSSVQEESDLAPHKPWCDVIVCGDAHVPGAKPMRRFEAGVRVSQEGRPIVDKRLTILGPRYWQKRFLRSWTLTPSDPIHALPLRYEYAFGGQCRVGIHDPANRRVKSKQRLSSDQRAQHPDGLGQAPAAHTACPDNPIGRGFAETWYLRAAKPKRLPAPQIESPQDPIRTFRKSYAPQGLGVIGRAWSARRKLSGTVDASFIKSERVLPKDFDFAYWNGAHPDLQLPWLQGDETIDLINIPVRDCPANRTDSRGNRMTRVILPGCLPYLLAYYDEGPVLPAELHLDTLRIDALERQAVMVWRAWIPVIPEVHTLEARLISRDNKAAQDNLRRALEVLHE